MKISRLAVGLTAVLALSGCSLFPVLPFAPHAGVPSGVSEGDCLSALNGRDSDRTSRVSCTEPHLFDVVGVKEWPGMAASVAASSAADEFDDIIADRGDANTYFDWAEATCSTYLRHVAGLGGVTVHGKRADDVWLMPGGTFWVDLSLASRDAFIAGDHSTVCSAGWYNDAGNAAVTYPADVKFGDVLKPVFPTALRDCETFEGDLVSCDQPHDAQILLDFDGLATFGADAIKAPSQMTDDDWAPFDDFCWSLFASTFPKISFDDFRGGAIEGIGDEWDALEAGDAVDTTGRYFFDCAVAAGADGEQLTGDVLSGKATSTGTAT
jgi:hypothetical protein